MLLNQCLPLPFGFNHQPAWRQRIIQMSPSVFVASALAQHRCPGQKLTQWIVIVQWICVADFLRQLFTYCRRIFVADFRGGFPAESPVDLSKSCGGFVQVQNPVNYMSKSHRTSTTKIHRNSSPHARLVCDCTLPVFFTACFAACPSTGILHYVAYTADFFRGGFSLADFARRISSAADFFRGFRWPSVITHQT